MSEPPTLVTVTPNADEPLDAAFARSLAQPVAPLADLAVLTNVAMGDPYLAEQLAMLRHSFEIRPPASTGLIDRLRTRLAWWLLGREITQITQVHATLTRVIDSLVVLVDQERSARRRIEEQLSAIGRSED
jgi:hypothetical protein